MLKARRPVFYAALPLLAALLLSGCTARQNVDLSLDGSGTARVNITLSPILVSYLSDLASTVGSAPLPKTGSIFDIASVRSAFSRYPGLTLVSAKNPGRDSLELVVRFADISRVFSAVSGGGAASSEGASAPFATFTTQGGIRTLTVRVGRTAVTDMLGLTPLSGSVAADVLLPPKGYSMTPEEYVSYLSWALADYAKNGDAKAVIRNATIDVRVHVSGTIVSQSGGTLSGNTVQFSLPVVDILTAETPRVYSIRYR